jgi:4,5-dihydroxyphthalate decarboxylase
VANIPLSFVCGLYDRMQPLYTGEVTVADVDLDFIVEENPRAIFDLMAGSDQYDAAEMSSSEYISQVGAGDCPFVALPVFPSRMFRHGFTCVNRHAGIETPKDLEGKRVGLPLYTMTAALWVRGQLQHEYDVDLDKIHWVQGAINAPGNHGDPSARPLLKPVPIEINGSGKSLNDLLVAGEIDATLGSTLPRSLGKNPDIVRLFPDFHAVEREYYERTKIHPIMHLTVLRRDAYEKNPWIAQNLYHALNASKNKALDKMRYTGASRYMLPWLRSDIDEIDEVFGGDPWPYGIEANRPTLEAMVDYLVEQNFIAKPIPLEELFVPVNE